MVYLLFLEKGQAEQESVLETERQQAGGKPGKLVAPVRLCRARSISCEWVNLCIF